MIEIQNHFAALSHEEADSWDTLKHKHNAAAEAVFGIRPSKHHEWISDDTGQLVDDKCTARLAGDLEDYKELNTCCKKSARLNKQRWAEEKAELGKLYLSQGYMRDAFAHFRQLRSTCPLISSLIHKTETDGEL